MCIGLFKFRKWAALGVLGTALAVNPVWAQSEVSVMASALPVASVVGTASAVVGSTAVAGAAVSAVPVALSVAGATLVVKAVEVTASGTLYLLERASDGARVSVRVASQMATGVAIGVGALVVVSVTATGIVLSTVGEVLAFIPNELGRALLYNERVTR